MVIPFILFYFILFDSDLLLSHLGDIASRYSSVAIPVRLRKLQEITTPPCN